MYQIELKNDRIRAPIELKEEEIIYIKESVEKCNFKGGIKAPGWDLINQNILREKTENMNNFLTRCIIECLQKGYIPQNLASSRLIPFNKIPGGIPTKGDIRNIATQPIMI